MVFIFPAAVNGNGKSFFRPGFLLFPPPAVLEDIRFPVIQDFTFGYFYGPAWFPYTAVREHEAILASIARHLEIEDHVSVIVEIIIPVPGDLPDRRKTFSQKNGKINFRFGFPDIT